jgi:hypothetical protein
MKTSTAAIGGQRGSPSGVAAATSAGGEGSA